MILYALVEALNVTNRGRLVERYRVDRHVDVVE
jgi:hypothetical protein